MHYGTHECTVTDMMVEKSGGRKARMWQRKPTSGMRDRHRKEGPSDGWLARKRERASNLDQTIPLGTQALSYLSPSLHLVLLMRVSVRRVRGKAKRSEESSLSNLRRFPFQYW